MKVSARPNTASLKDFANHIIVGVMRTKFLENLAHGPRDVPFFDYPSDRQLQHACNQGPATGILARNGIASFESSCVLFLSPHPEHVPQIFPKPKIPEPGDQVMIVNDESLSGRKMDSVGPLVNLLTYHHWVGTLIEKRTRTDSYMDESGKVTKLHGSCGWHTMTVEFTHPDDPKLPPLRKEFPAEHIKVSPNTWLQAFCYTNIWMRDSYPRYHTDTQLLPWHVRGQMPHTWTGAIQDFQELLKSDDIELALQIEDMYHHNALEIMVREATEWFAPQVAPRPLALKPVEFRPDVSWDNACTLINSLSVLDGRIKDKTIFNRMVRTSVGGGGRGLIQFPPEPIFQAMLQLQPVIDTINFFGEPASSELHENVERLRINHRFGPTKSNPRVKVGTDGGGWGLGGLFGGQEDPTALTLAMDGQGLNIKVPQNF